MRIHIVINPVAGRGRGEELCTATADALRARGATVSHYVSRAAGDIGNHVLAMEPGHCDRMVIGGGDGTVAEVLNCGRDLHHPAIGVLPLGTANLAARELRMPIGLKIERWAEGLLRAEAWTVDLMQATTSRGTQDNRASRLALATVGAGADGAVVHATSKARRSHGGFGGYARWIAPSIKTLSEFAFHPLVVTLDASRTTTCSAIVIQKAATYGGLFRLKPTAGLDSGHMRVFLLDARAMRDFPRYALGGLTARLLRFRDVRSYACEVVHVKSSAHVAVQADGDPAGHTDLTVSIVRGAATLLRAPS